MRRKPSQIIDILQFANKQPTLQSQIKSMDIANPSKDLYFQMKTLTKLAMKHKLVSLSANQLGFQQRMFTVLSDRYILPNLWRHYQGLTPDSYEIIINPQISSESKIRVKDFQECPSLPGMVFSVWTPISQHFKYIKPSMNHQTQQISFSHQKRVLNGFNSRVWDHQIRHLDGCLAINQLISHNQYYLDDDYRVDGQNIERYKVLRMQQQVYQNKNMKKYMQDHKNADVSKNSEDIPDQINKQFADKFNLTLDDVAKIKKNQGPLKSHKKPKQHKSK